MSSFQVVSVVANFDGFRLARGNRSRIEVGKSILDWASAERASIVVFPAGYLRAVGPSPAHLLGVSNPLLAKAAHHNIAVIVGVDTCPPSMGKTDLDLLVLKGRLPFFALAWAPGMRALYIWRQRSVNSRKWSLAPATSWTRVRTLPVSRTDVAVLICGEAFSTPARHAIVRAVPKPSLVAIPAHGAKGSRHWQALKFFSLSGMPTLRAVHADYHADNLLWVGGKKRRAVSRQSFNASNGAFAAEASLLKV